MMISKTTVQQIKTFCRPGIDSGLIDQGQFSELMKLAKTSQGHAPDTKPKTQLLTVQDVAKRLACSTRTVHRMRDSGRLRGVYLTDSQKSLRFSELELEALLEGGPGHE